MSQWSFVLAAYAAVGLTTIGLILWAWLSMHTAEADAEAIKRQK